MSIRYEGDETQESEASRKRRWLVVAMLFFLTLGGTAAARLATGTDANPDSGQPHDLTQQVVSQALSLDGRLDRGAVHVGGDGLVHLELIATGATLPDLVAARQPTDVVVVLDRSGSMQGAPMAQALGAIRELVGQLGFEDRFALVSYSSGVEISIPLETATSEARLRWVTELASITPGGGTNMSAGLDQAHSLVSNLREAGRVARIILLSDGHANEGDATPEGLTRRSGRAISGEYVLSTVGVGEGFDERLMSRLADAGTGNFYYVPHFEALAGIFADEFESARETVASALEFRIETPTGVEVLDAAGYPLESHAGYVVVRPGSLFSQQKRSLWVTLRVPAEHAGETVLGDVTLRYRTRDGGRHVAKLPEFPAIAAVVDQTKFVASLDKDAVETHHVEEVVNRLRQSVSQLVSSGKYDMALERIDAVDYVELESMGLDAKDTNSFAAIEILKKEVARAAAAPAAKQSAVRTQLGKSLFESGTDGRRKGAKR